MLQENLQPSAPAPLAKPPITTPAPVQQHPVSEFNTQDVNVIKNVIALRDDANQYYESTIEQTVTSRYNTYFAEPAFYKRKFPKLSQYSNLVSTDVADTIEWCLPSLMKVFFGSEEVISIQGVNPEDDNNAQVMQELITYQLQRKNKAFMVFYNWFKDALITGCGIVKCYWDRQVQQEVLEDIIGVEQMQAMQQSQVQIVSSAEISPGIFKVQYSVGHTVNNHPKIENIPISELRYSPSARNIDEAPFVAHKKTVTADYLRRREMEGVYQNVEEAIAGGSDPTVTQLDQTLLDNYDQVTSALAVDDASKRYEIYECYVDLDVNNDGLLEKMIITICGNTILRMEENHYGRHPFFILSPTKDPHRIWPKKAYADLIGQLQDLKTAMMRQIMLNIALNNDPRMVVSEEAVNIDDYISGRAVIRKKAGYQMNEAVQPLPVQPLAPWTWEFLQFIDSQKENSTGITKYNQGMDSNTLNKTATGISAIMSASNQRLELIARMFSETGISELFRFLVELNRKFIDEATVIRLDNKPLTITPDDLTGDFDLIVNAGMGMGTKEMTIMNLQTMLTTILQVMGAGVPIAQPMNIYNLMARWIEELGFKNKDDYITNPMVLQQQQQAQMAGQIPPQVQQQLAMLPPDQQQAALAQMMGGQNTGNMGPGGTPQGFAPASTFRGAGGGGQGIPNGVLQSIQQMATNKNQVLSGGGTGQIPGLNGGY